MSTASGRSPDYVIRGGVEGKRRLELMMRTLWPATFRLLKRTGFGEGMRCLDVGCGSGDVTLGIARLAGPTGMVVGIDIDAVKLEAARAEATRQNLAQVEFREVSVYELPEESAFDRVYSRFLLTHLPDPGEALSRMRRALGSGGTVVIEDIDFTGSFCYPRCRAYERYVELYRQVVLRRRGDPDIGLKLHGLLNAAGFLAVQLDLAQPLHADQEGKALHLVTLMNIADALTSESLADAAEIDRLVRELDEFTNDPTTVIGGPRIFQAWGTRA